MEERPVLQVGVVKQTIIVQMNFWSRLLFSPHKHYLVQTAGPMFDPLSLCPPGSAMTSLQQYGKENLLEW